MIAHTNSRPHPVLAPFTDDIAPNTCALTLELSHDADWYYFRAAFDYSNPSIATLVAEGKAVHGLHIECRRNYHRELILFAQPSHDFQLSTSAVVGRVDISGFILAQQDLAQLRISGAHPDAYTSD
jgi:hypothetical protein